RVFCALSFGPLSHMKISGMTAFSLFDYVSSNICLPVGGFVCSIFVGWFVDVRFLRGQIKMHSTAGRFVLRLLVFCLRWICPMAILLILLNSVGFIG
ncbi:MAG: sodium-dependent transporter, partial [Duncaniella sp.]|nr:sodium-dependent transporter [Duncaniella sp.]